jgi:glycosyltransferase involved in cell wall biosynthesis
LTQTPKISVITRTRNRPRLLARVLNGLEAQSFKDFELLIINDGGDIPVIETTLPHRLINLPENLGRAGAADTGLREAIGGYVLFHDDDDSLRADALEKLSEALDTAPDCIGAICGYEIIREDNAGADFRPTGQRETHIPELPPTLNDLAFANSLLTISTLFRREAALKAGGITLGLDALEDWDLWLRLMLEGDFALVKEALAYQHLRTDETDGAYAQSAKAEHDAARIRLLNHYLREDIKAGRQGLGHLMNVQNRQTIEDLSHLTGLLKNFKRRVFFWRR